MQTVDSIGTIVSRWRTDGVPLREGVRPEEIASFESSHGVVLPHDVRLFLATVNGMHDRGWDGELMHLWPLSEIGPVSVLDPNERGEPRYAGIEARLPDAASHFGFADYSIQACAYAVRMTHDPREPGTVVSIFDDLTCVTVANSFSEFLHRYASDPITAMFQ